MGSVGSGFSLHASTPGPPADRLRRGAAHPARWTSRRRWARTAEHAMRFVFPPTCCGCRQRCRRPGFCDSCRRLVFEPVAAICPRCGLGHAAPPNHLCGRCISDPPAFGRARACATYPRSTADAPLARALHALKYGRDVSYAKPLARILLGRAPTDRDYDAVVPVPLHVDRLRWRGFNQAVLLAGPLARLWQKRMECLALTRIRPTRPQVGLGEAERRRNVVGAFEIGPGWSARGKRILVVDDVYTTGATVEECSRLLLDDGALRVDALVLARAQ